MDNSIAWSSIVKSIFRTNNLNSTMTMRSIILLALVSLSIGSQIDTYNDYLVFAAKNHFKSVSQYAGSVGLDQFDSQWEQFKVKFNKNFDKEHEEIRKFNFLKKLQFIKSHNEKFDSGLVSHSVDINQFADWSPEEFKAMMGEMPLINMNNTKGFLKPKLQSASLPRSFDWRSKGKVTPVKSQGQCGSCWAFSSVGAVESGFLINENRRTSLSEQELVDCSGGNNMGCRGGFTKDALLFIQEYGLATESQYPYYAQDGNCQYNEQRSKVNKIPKTYYIEPLAADEDMMDAVMNYGPITVAINADGNDFMHYRSGIISSGGRTITHAVVVVGWGPGYWIIKNSWDVTWGMNGFGYIAQNNNVRNINSQVFFPGWK